MDKKGQGLSTNTIILLILGIVILVVLILGFTMGWDKLAPWISQDNVDTIKTQCNLACSTNSQAGWCTQERTLKFSGDISGLTSGQKYKCVDLVNKGIGIEACDAITCD